jgi:hypothetical protein
VPILAVVAGDLGVTLTLDELTESGVALVPPRVEQVPGPTLDCFQTADFLLGELAVSPRLTLHSHPLAQVESPVVYVIPWDAAVALALNESFKLGETLVPG